MLSYRKLSMKRVPATTDTGDIKSPKSPASERKPGLVRRKRQDRSQVAVQDDRQLAVLRYERDLIHQRAKHLDGFHIAILVAEAPAQR